MQPHLFDSSATVTGSLPLRATLGAVNSLLETFEDCHNYIYANEGLLKDKVFREVTKLLLLKYVDERFPSGDQVQFGITLQEYQEAIKGASPAFSARLSQLANLAKAEFGELDLDDYFPSLRLQSLAYFVGAIQRLSLTACSTDVKGEAFQTFVGRHHRGPRGEYFTPPDVVRCAVSLIAPEAGETVLDPACGTGGFLIETLKRLGSEGANLKDPEIAGKIRGQEFNPEVALAASVNVLLSGGSEHSVRHANSLTDQPWDTEVDVILTNPPFGSKGKIDESDLLHRFDLGFKWREARDGSWQKTELLLDAQTPEILFIEKCIRLLRPGGRMAIVLPDGILQNLTSGHVRTWMRRNGCITGVLSLPQETFLPYGTGVKTSVVMYEKGRPESSGQCFMAFYTPEGVDSQVPYGNGKPKRGPAVEAQFSEFRRTGQVDGADDTCYGIPLALLCDRLDVEHYLPSDLALIDALKAGGAVSLSQLATIVTKHSDFRKRPDELIRYVAISNIDFRGMCIVSHDTLIASEAPSRASYSLRAGDIITATSGGKTGTSEHVSAFVSEEYEGAICSNGLAVLRQFRGIDPLYLLGYLRTPTFLRQVRRLRTGHAIPCITSDDLGRVLVPVPGPAEQARVRDIILKSLELRKEAESHAQLAVAASEDLIASFVREQADLPTSS